MASIQVTAVPRLTLHAHGVDVTFEDPDIDESADARGVRSFLRAGRFYEAAFLDYIRGLGLAGSYVDVGGFIGTHTLYFAMLCQSDRVYTFEPRPGPRGELERNIAANGQQHKVIVSALGLADARRTVELVIEGKQTSFECAPMDELVDRPVAVIKIDVEGMEVDVLRGAERILDQFHPVVFAEAHTHEHRRAIADCLARYGYVQTGRVFNASPTYEYARFPETGVAEELRRAYVDLGRANDEVAKVKSTLVAAQHKYRDATAHEKAITTRLRIAEAEIGRLRGELQDQEARLRVEVRNALRKEEQKNAQNTLSFQLGNSLIQATKSARGLLALPRALVGLRTEAAARRKRLQKPRVNEPGGDAGDLISVYERSKRTARPRPERRFSPPPILTRADLSPTERLARLRVAGIMDEFTAASFGPECSMLQLRPSTWMHELPRFAPELLFVESAWRGIDDSWAGGIGVAAPELRALIEWCRTEGIPTVFWNKEDPVHFAGFSNTASLFDFVFTTDIDCIHRYKELLGHERVFLLPFAAQPRVHNPIEHYERKNALCFAGAYYARYPERQRDFLNMLDMLKSRWPIEIFDRNHGDDNPDYQFPEEYRRLIRGKLPFDQIDRAYKGYRYAINLNSIKYSQSMFARRVFELLASNTVTISNFSRGIRLLLGDLVIASDDPAHQVARLDDISRTPMSMHGFRLAGLRKVLTEHTYQDRLADIVAHVFGIESLRLLPEITVLGVARSADETTALRAAFDRQTYPHKRLVLVADLPGSDRLARHLGPSGRVATFVAADYYGPSYLSDLALSTRYWTGMAAGKVAHYAWRDGAISLVDGGKEYRPASVLAARAALVSPAVFSDMTAGAFLADAETRVVRGDFLAIDELGYCRDGMRAATSEVAAAVDGPTDLDTGVDLARLLSAAEQIPEPEHDVAPQRTLGPAGLAGLFAATQKGEIETVHENGLTIVSSLPDRQHSYIYGGRMFSLKSLGFGETGKLFVDVTTGLNISVVLRFLDSEGERIGHLVLNALTNHEVQIPPATVAVQLGFRVLGPGRATVHAVVFGSVTSSEPTRVFGRHDLLVCTNIYPTQRDLYRNAFVHRRVLEYARRGRRVDVFRIRAGSLIDYYEFDGVDVVRGGKHVLQSLLATRQHRTVLVHFLDEAMWESLEPQLDRLNVIVWLHGGDVHPWQRRSFNYTTPEEIERAQKASQRRVELWNRVLRVESPNLHFVTVSRTLANEIEEDYGISFSPARHSVIHNVIDTELFRYVPKPAAQRTKILSIRPFSSRIYANDLSVAAILELAKRPWFGELEFLLIGDGPLFEATVAPLQGLRNVVVERRFIRQDEIAALHRRHGVFLCPTRMDSQGVSRDEAMASGLVPVTTRIAAVPEFVDEECGFLARPENAVELANALETLYRDPALFERMSAAAAARVRQQSGPEQTVERELALIKNLTR